MHNPYPLESLKGQIALFGGSFDPPHYGHSVLMRYLLEILQADEIWCFPTYKHALEKQQRPFSLRVQWLNNLVKKISPQIKVRSDEEFLVKQGSQGRTYYLLKHLINKYPEKKFRLIVGSDILYEQDKWFKFNEVASLGKLMVIERKGYPTDAKLKFNPPEISSSQIRAAIQEQQPIWPYVNKELLQDIIESKDLF